MIPVGAFTLRAATGNGSVTKAGVKASDLKQNQIGVNYALSKRTTAYMYSGTTKDAAAGAAPVDKKTSTIYGVLHTF